MSVWRGKFNSSAGKITLDKQANAGTIEVTIDMKSFLPRRDSSTRARWANPWLTQRYFVDVSTRHWAI